MPNYFVKSPGIDGLVQQRWMWNSLAAVGLLLIEITNLNKLTGIWIHPPVTSGPVLFSSTFCPP